MTVCHGDYHIETFVFWKWTNEIDSHGGHGVTACVRNREWMKRPRDGHGERFVAHAFDTTWDVGFD
jgi:hypothetical protein